MINEEATAKAEESDEELFTVPDVEDTKKSNNSNNNNSNNNNTYTSSNLHQAAGSTDINDNNNNNNNGANINASSPAGGDPPPKRKRGRNPVDKEYRRLKRLLRNRVSAQQARERKKVYVNDLEARAHELHDQNLKLEEKISTLVNENTMLRKILMNTRPKVDDSVEAEA